MRNKQIRNDGLKRTAWWLEDFEELLKEGKDESNPRNEAKQELDQKADNRKAITREE